MFQKKSFFSMIQFLVFIIFFCFFTGQSSGSVAAKKECVKTFESLNNVKANPDVFSSKIGANFKGIKALPGSIRDERLACYAENPGIK